MGQYSDPPLMCHLSICLESLINPKYRLILVTFGPGPNVAKISNSKVRPKSFLKFEFLKQKIFTEFSHVSEY